MTARTKQNLAELYPLTALQQGLLYHALAVDQDDPYLVRVCFRIEGAVDAAALQRAWQTVIDRHEALRSDLEWVKSKQPIQMVFRDCPLALEEHDWRAAPAAEQPAKLAALVDELAARYALPRAADQRVALVRSSDEAGYLVWIFHHVLLDGWSVANVLAEVLSSYHAAVGGPPAELAPVPSHAKYLAWLRAQDVPAAEAYWRSALAGYEPIEFPPAAAPPDWAAPPVRSPDHRAGYAERALVLSDELAAELRALASRAHVTLATCFQAALALLVRAYTGADDLVFGATVAGRPAELTGASAMVGAFINTVCVRVRVRGGEALDAWLQALHREGGQRRAFEHLGLPRIQELAGIPAGRALFEALLVFENFPVSAVLDQADALPFAVEPHRLHAEEGGVLAGRGRNNFPLTFVVLPGRKLELVLAYHRERVSDDAAGAMLSLFGEILQALGKSAPATRLGALAYGRASAAAAQPAMQPALQPALQSAAQPATRPSEPRTIHARIAHWAAATPQALAVRDEQTSLSYAALDAAADQLARQLRARGVIEGSRVALCLPRSADFIVALYAVLKCGAAYVPCEPEHPKARLAATFADARVAAVIARPSALAALAGAHAQLVAWPSPSPSPSPAPSTSTSLEEAAGAPVHVAVHPEAPAYLIYTSGSTGAPKGVVVSHRALDAYVRGVTERLTRDATASMAMISTVAADLGHTSLFGALCNGGALHLVSEERAGDPDGFAELMSAQQIASLKIVPGHLWGLMQPGSPERSLPAHTLILGGEAAPRPLLEALRAQRRCRVINHYGPTETTVGILTCELAPDDGADPGAPLPLGTPLAGATAYVLGADLRPTPVGAVGEIFLGGESLAAGYYRRPELTAERFVPSPFSSPSSSSSSSSPSAPGGGERLYRTGDRGRLRADGAIEFLGRADDQVKLRGFRVELGEIRAELLRLPRVADARVLVRPGAAGAPQLVGYLVGEAADRAAADALLRGRLPEHMVPAELVWLPRFPVTANGKVDLARLPEPQLAERAAPAAAAARPPVTENERALAAIWAEILGAKQQLHRDDNFFQLGGDSILALKIVARARKAGLKITPKQLLAHPTLEEAARVAQPIAAAPAPSAASSEGRGSAPTSPAAPSEIPLTPIQLHFLETQRLDPHHYNQAILLTLSAPIALPILERALAQLAEHHPALRLRFRQDGERWRAALAPASLPAAPPAVLSLDLRATPDAELPAAIERACDEWQRGFDLERGPLLRAGYLHLGDPGDPGDLGDRGDRGDRGEPGPGRQPRLLLFAHHLVVDGVSWRILLEDLAELVTAALAGRPAELPAPTTPFHDFTQRLHAHAPSLLPEAARWARTLAQPASAREPRREPNLVGDSAIATVELDEATTAALLGRAPRAYDTVVNELMLAALATALCKRWQEPAALITVEGHGREDLFDGVDLSRTVGWFATAYPVRLVPAEDYATTIANVRGELRSLPHHGLGYGVLRHLVPGALAPVASPPRVTFNYLGQFDQAFARQALFRVAPEQSGRRRSPHTPRDSWFVVNAVVYEGVLRIDWEYSRALHERGEVLALLAAYVEELRALIDPCTGVAVSSEPRA